MDRDQISWDNRAYTRQATFTISVLVALVLKASRRIEPIITEVQHKHPNNYIISFNAQQ